MLKTSYLSTANKNSYLFDKNEHKQQKKQRQIACLTPLIQRKSKRLYKIIEQKQNKFVLDCTNKIRSTLKQYSYLQDKYLNYCIVKIPKRKRIVVRNRNLNSHKTSDDLRNEKQYFMKNTEISQSNQNFNKFLKSKKEQILFQNHALSSWYEQKQNKKGIKVNQIQLNQQESKIIKQNKQSRSNQDEQEQNFEKNDQNNKKRINNSYQMKKQKISQKLTNLSLICQNHQEQLKRGKYNKMNSKKQQKIIRS